MDDQAKSKQHILSNDLDKLASTIIGQKIDGYEVKREIGRGGTSIVYEALDPNLNRKVALKVLWTPLVKDASLIQRFHREAEAAANLRHPNIVPIYAMGHRENLHYFAMELIQGESVEEIIDRTGKIEPARAIGIIKKVALSLSYAHQQGIIHRDIKPSNIMIDNNDRVLVTDFGLVKSKKWKEVTSTQTVLGTPVYMSPEQAQGYDTDKRCDIYSLGVVFYHMLTGRVPFDAAEPIAILRKVIDEDPPEPRSINPAIPRDLDTIIMKCLEKQPANRYENMGLFLNDLEHFENHRPLRTKRSQITYIARRQREKLLKAAMLAIIIMLVSGFFTIFFISRQDTFVATNILKDRAANLTSTDILMQQGQDAALLDKSSNHQPGRDELPAELVKELADIIYLNNGRVVMGIIEEATEDEVILRLKIGTVTYEKDKISSISYSTPQNRQKLKEFWSKR